MRNNGLTFLILIDSFITIYQSRVRQMTEKSSQRSMSKRYKIHILGKSVVHDLIKTFFGLYKVQFYLKNTLM